MIYMFGKLVTAQEKAYLSKVLAKESDRLAQGKHFKAIYNTAKREGVDLIKANDIVELQLARVDRLNKRLNGERTYYVDARGEVGRSIRDLRTNHIFKRHVSEQELDIIENGYTVNPTEPKKTFFSEAKKSVKKVWGFLKEALSVY